MDREEDVDEEAVSVGGLGVRDWNDGEVLYGLDHEQEDMDDSSSVKGVVNSVVTVVADEIEFWSAGLYDESDELTEGWKNWGYLSLMINMYLSSTYGGLDQRYAAL